jgi:hypothetical protein
LLLSQSVTTSAFPLTLDGTFAAAIMIATLRVIGISAGEPFIQLIIGNVITKSNVTNIILLIAM